LNANKIIELGHVIDGLHPGRESENEITIFDGTDISLQDISVGRLALGIAIERNFEQVVTL
jgi:ornithine cyclodeaminase/alanine dehydrogenase-like protein (mu-crystallin family)